MSIKNNLIEEFNSQLEEVSKMEVGSEKYKIAMDGITKLADRITDIEKLESEQSLKYDRQTMDDHFKEKQMKVDKQDKLIGHAIDGVKVCGGLGLTAWAFVASMNFEKNGHLFSTEGGKNALRSILKFMK